MDKKITELIVDIDDVLSFVEDVEVLKDKLKHFLDTIQQILETIIVCSSLIREYLDAGVVGMRSNGVFLNILISFSGRIWKALIGMKQIEDCQKKLGDLSRKLNERVDVHMAHKVDEIHGIGKFDSYHNQLCIADCRLST